MYKSISRGASITDCQDYPECALALVFVPHAYEGDRPAPLILFLHGAGDAGTDDTGPEPFHKVCLSLAPASPRAFPASFANPSGKSWFEGYSACTRYNHVMRPNTWGCVFDSFPRTFGLQQRSQ